MENIKINIEDYPEYLGDIYYSLITFVGRYANQNFDAMETFTSEQSDYAKAIITGKQTIKSILDFFTQYDAILVTTTGESFKISELTHEQQQRLLQHCTDCVMRQFEQLQQQNTRSM